MLKRHRLKPYLMKYNQGIEYILKAIVISFEKFLNNDQYYLSGR